ncbi:hypothetical protein B0H14DRAFT_2610428 [Mycena olivaceomarginata]|nr:hypothetical protein B0H14DRAFT_2610428 [Mycena olivaceomarginata]
MSQSPPAPPQSVFLIPCLKDDRSTTLHLISLLYPQITNAGKLLPSIDILFQGVLQRERSMHAGHPCHESRIQSAWPGFPPLDRGIGGHSNSSLTAPIPFPSWPHPPPKPVKTSSSDLPIWTLTNDTAELLDYKFESDGRPLRPNTLPRKWPTSCPSGT